MTPRKNPKATSEWVENELIVLNQDRGQVHKLNESAAVIFELCDGQRGRDQILQRMADLFDAVPEQLGRDLDQTLDSFQSLGLILIDE